MKLKNGVRELVIKVEALEDKGHNSLIFMRYIMYAFRTPITFTSDDKIMKIIIRHLDLSVIKLCICSIFMKEDWSLL